MPQESINGLIASKGPKPAAREKRVWWAVTDNCVTRVTGHACHPSDSEEWWCPVIGQTLKEKTHLFAEEGRL